MEKTKGSTEYICWTIILVGVICSIFIVPTFIVLDNPSDNFREVDCQIVSMEGEKKVQSVVNGITFTETINVHSKCKLPTGEIMETNYSDIGTCYVGKKATAIVRYGRIWHRFISVVCVTCKREN
jgi:hypothetical protein